MVATKKGRASAPPTLPSELPKAAPKRKAKPAEPEAAPSFLDVLNQRAPTREEAPKRKKDIAPTEPLSELPVVIPPKKRGRGKTVLEVPAPDVFERQTSQVARPGQETSGNFLDTMNVLSSGFDLRTGQAPVQNPAELGKILDECLLPATLPSSQPYHKAQSKAQIKREMDADLLKQREEIPLEVIAETTSQLLSWDQIRRNSVALVNIPNADLSDNTVNDPRMGVLTTGLCSSCHRDLTHCPSHDGHIEFARKIYHPLFIEECALVLTCLSPGCGKVRLSEFTIRANHLRKLSGISALRLCADLAMKEGFCACEACHGRQNLFYNIPASKKRGEIVYRMTKASKVEKVMDIEDVFRLFSQISVKDAQLLGFANGAMPIDMIMQGMVVVGPAARPPTIENGELLNDHLTSMYIDIVKMNNLIADPSVSEVQREQTFARFKFAITHFINNADGKYNNGHSQPYKGIQQRLQGKSELRGHSMGKRVLYSSRTVIGPDLTLDFGEASIPEAFCSTLTKPVRVFTANLNEIRRLWADGKVTHITSANPSHPSYGIKRAVSEKMRAAELPQIGDEVERDAALGDVFYNNRQPTLHSLGMRSFDLVPRKAKSVGLTLEDTKPFNADFDGDEMNQHIPRSLMAEAEARFVSHATECLMNGQNDTPAVGFKLDVVSGFYQMTLRNQPVAKIDFFDATTHIVGLDLLDLEDRARHFDMPLFTTRVLISALFPRDFYYRGKTARVERGILISGVLGNSDTGPVSRSISQFLWKRYGKARMVQWLTDARRLVLRWQRDNPLTFGIEECLPQDRVAHKNAIKEIVQGAKVKIAALGAAPDAAADPIAAQKHEEQVRGYLNVAGSIGEAVEKYYDPDNPLFVMTKSGAKGNAGNVAQISSLIGQQYLRGERLLPRTPGGRTLSYYDVNDTDLEAYGFINNSFLEGLNGPEFFMLMMAGREGLVDTANTTAVVGASNHAVIKACEDLRIAEDGSVRNAQNAIIQPLYGYHGLAGASLIRTQIGSSTDKQKVSQETVATFVDLREEIAHLNAKAKQWFG